jgi:large subunit ribosomal protein L15
MKSSLRATSKRHNIQEIVMSLHNLFNTPGSVRRKKRVGCGESSGHGKTSCRGTKGQMSRSGHKRKPNFEGGQMKLIRRMPKVGFSNAAHSRVFDPVNLDQLASFADGAEVSPETLAQAGILRDPKHEVKILAGGEFGRKLSVKAHAFSATARAKIEAAGGTCTVIG